MSHIQWRLMVSFSAGKSIFFSFSLSLNALCQVATAILWLPPTSVSFIRPCVTVKLQRASPLLWEASLGSQCVGEDFCLASHLSVAYLNHAHSCHLPNPTSTSNPTPLPPPPNFSLFSFGCHTEQNITLSFSSAALLHFVSRTKRHFSVCHPDEDWQGIEAFCCVNSSEIALKVIPPSLVNRPWLHLTPWQCFVMEIQGFYVAIETAVIQVTGEEVTRVNVRKLPPLSGHPHTPGISVTLIIIK